MTPANSVSIFREEARRRYLQGRAEQVLPQIVSPPVFRCLWALAAILIAGLAVGSGTEMPAYVSAPAIVLPCDGSARVVAFFPPGIQDRIRRGHFIWIATEGTVVRDKAVVLSAETKVISAAQARHRYGASAGTVADAAGPSVVVVAEWTRASAVIGKVYRAEVKTGSRSVLSMLHVIGPRLGE